jgi:hypothetical protein
MKTFKVRAIVKGQQVSTIVNALTKEDARQIARRELGYEMQGKFFSLHWSQITSCERVTYDVVFNDDSSSNSKGFTMSRQDALDYIKNNNGTNNSYFADYKEGVVQVVENQSGDVVHEEVVL